MGGIVVDIRLNQFYAMQELPKVTKTTHILQSIMNLWKFKLSGARDIYELAAVCMKTLLILVNAIPR
jgi:hypothetical protein